MDLFASYKHLDDPFQALTTLDHVHHEHTLVESILSQYLFLKVFVAATNAHQELPIVYILFDI